MFVGVLGYIVHVCIEFFYKCSCLCNVARVTLCRMFDHCMYHVRGAVVGHVCKAAESEPTPGSGRAGQSRSLHLQLRVDVLALCHAGATRRRQECRVLGVQAGDAARGTVKRL